ncbi:nucleotide exchange factor GrpE [Caldalkalibacillus thermarum]|uniref:nucleotide exchange factor GrpE n=1 Tax=Caldalkalibacillus thermarum TaxID=296745 RepID=UPI00166DD942|nr:nucleotide exchange factor GrpE [Caldalkalibacillus thermarum]GGK18396.1 nucleotide exchange factor GrpE [Caldalkalibacillus thermarum]
MTGEKNTTQSGQKDQTEVKETEVKDQSKPEEEVNGAQETTNNQPESNGSAQESGRSTEQTGSEDNGNENEQENAQSVEEKLAAQKQPSVEELQAQLEEALQKADEYYQRYLRAQADFDNFRKRTRKEKEELQKYAALPVIEQLLPVLDNFERALAAGQSTKDAESLMKGVEMVFKQVQQVLTKQGLEEIEAVGKPFDPHFHEAVMQVESEEHESGIVVEELQKGYMLKGKVIRPAMVKVSQ